MPLTTFERRPPHSHSHACECGDGLKNIALLDLSSILTDVVDGIRMSTPALDTLIFTRRFLHIV